MFISSFGPLVDCARTEEFFVYLVKDLACMKGYPNNCTGGGILTLRGFYLPCRTPFVICCNLTLNSQPLSALQQACARWRVRDAPHAHSQQTTRMSWPELLPELRPTSGTGLFTPPLRLKQKKEGTSKLRRAEGGTLANAQEYGEHNQRFPLSKKSIGQLITLSPPR